MTQLKRLENSTLLFPRQIISRWGRPGSGGYIFSWPTINLQREKQKCSVSELSSIVISQAANIRNNTMKMDLRNYQYLSLRAPPFFKSTRRKWAHVVLYIGLSVIDVRQLEIDLFLLRSPLFSPGCKAYGNQTSLISPTCRVKWTFKPP